jgi:hypothetical protein
MTKTPNFNMILKLAYGKMEGGFENDSDDEKDLNELFKLINLNQNGTNNRQRTNIVENVEEDNKPEDIGGRIMRI